METIGSCYGFEMTRPLLSALLLAGSFAAAQEAEPLAEPVSKPSPVVEQKPTPPAPPPPTALELRGGTVGVGYLGLVSMVPISANLGGLGGLGQFRTQVPLIGVRWWLKNSRLGIDLGVGAMLSSGSPASAISLEVPPSLNFVAHVGLPIALVSTQHVIVLLSPEFRAGLATLEQASFSSLTSSLLELGLRGAIELFFSFIGVPALSLEASMRVGLSREAQGFTLISPLTPGESSTVTTETFKFSTSLSGDAASIVASTLALKYYF